MRDAVFRLPKSGYSVYREGDSKSVHRLHRGDPMKQADLRACPPLTRREALRLGFTGLGVASAALAWQSPHADLAAQGAPVGPPPDPQPNKAFPIMPT